MEEEHRCGVCGVSVKNLRDLIVVKGEMRCVCEKCVVKACNNCPCYTCGKPASFTFSTKKVIGHEEADGIRVTLYFPGCSKDCALKSINNSEEPLKKLLGSLVTDYDHQNVCKSCKKMGKDLKICTGCRLAWYCSSECQKNDWKVHKPYCQHPGNKPQPW